MSDTAAAGTGDQGNSGVLATPTVADKSPPPEGLTTGKVPDALKPATPAADAKAPDADTKPPEGEPGKTLATGAKLEDDTKSEAKDGEKPAAEAKPEEYTPIAVADLKLPEGLSAEDPLLAAALEGATEAKLSKEALQPLIDKVAPQLKEMREAPLREWAATQKKWQQEVKADPEIGGAALEKDVLPTIAKALDRFGGAKVREAVDFTGVGNHPEFVRFLYRASKALNEGTPVRGNPAAANRDPAAVLYNHPTSRVNGAA